MVYKQSKKFYSIICLGGFPRALPCGETVTIVARCTSTIYLFSNQPTDVGVVPNPNTHDHKIKNDPLGSFSILVGVGASLINNNKNL